MRSSTYDRQGLLGVPRGLSQVHEFCFAVHRGYGFDEFANDPKTVIAVTKCIEVVGEATKHIPDSFKTKYQEIPWRDMAGMRDRLVHGCFTGDLEIAAIKLFS